MLRDAKDHEGRIQSDKKEHKESSFENCEYMIAAINGKNELELADEKSLQEAYNIINTYSFPMNTNPLLADTLKGLSEEERKELDSNEYQFILKRIKKINPNLTIIPIPKSLYQFHDLVTQLHDPSTSTPQFKYGLKEKGSASEGDTSDIHQYSFNYHANTETRNAYIKTNQRFVEEWIRLFGNSIPKISYSSIFRLTDHLYDQFEQLMHDASEHKASVPKFTQEYYASIQNYIFSSDSKVNNLSRLFLQTLMCWEWSTKDNNGYYTLYRGGELDMTKKHCCRSYSDGVLGGASYDVQTGMAFSYSSPSLRSTGDEQLMALHINKKDYRLENQLKKGNAIYIPPIHNIGRVRGLGEHHHVRTTLACDFSYEDFLENYGGKTLVLKGNEHLLGKLPTREHYESVLFFLKENIQIIKPKAIFNVLINGQNPDEPFLSSLFPVKPRSLDDSSKPLVSSFFSRGKKANARKPLLSAKDDIELYRRKTHKH